MEVAQKRLDIDFARPIFDDRERNAVMRVMAGHWLASGKENDLFEREFAEYVGVPHAVCCNSGSSANLLALAGMDLKPGAKVITSACGFPATLAPILHLGLEPVLVDYDFKTHNIDIGQLIDAMSGASAVILAHTMGVPVDMRPVVEAAQKHGVKIIEDCCEAAGATLDDAQVGSFGDAGTFSFYPSHQITALGGGGMVVCKDEDAYHRMRSLRDWGKCATWDKGGRHNTSYSVEVDGIPYFPHYAYSTVGWNFKLPEANAAFGRVQLERLDGIADRRRQNHDYLSSCFTERFGKEFARIAVPDGAKPSWFGLILTLLNGSRDAFGNALESHGIRHRPWFAGNITRHVPFKHLGGDFPVADRLMRDSMFIGCWAGMTGEQLDYVVDRVEHCLAFR